jgi:hypothetical protein
VETETQTEMKMKIEIEMAGLKSRAREDSVFGPNRVFYECLLA